MQQGMKFRGLRRESSGGPEGTVVLLDNRRDCGPISKPHPAAEATFFSLPSAIPTEPGCKGQD